MTHDLRHFFELSSDLLGVIGADGRLREANPAFATAFERPAHDLTGQPFSSVFHPDDEHLGLAALEQAAHGAAPVSFESRRDTGTGDARRLRWTLHTDGASGVVYAVGRDITAVAQAEDRFRLAIEASPVAIVITDAAGTIMLVNQEIQRLFGYAEAELLGQTVEVLVPSKLRRAHIAHRDGFADAPGQRPMGHKRDLVARHRDGTEFPVEIGLSPLETQQGRGVLATVVDLTARVEYEAAQMKLISQLQTALDEVKTLRGFIPICANCKKVRDDTGFWQSVETYVSERTDADFSHHVCPECGPKLYPEFWDPAPDA